MIAKCRDVATHVEYGYGHGGWDRLVFRFLTRQLAVIVEEARADDESEGENGMGEETWRGGVPGTSTSTLGKSERKEEARLELPPHLPCPVSV